MKGSALIGIFVALWGCQKAPGQPAHQAEPVNRLGLVRDTPRSALSKQANLDELIIFTDGRNCVTAPVTTALLDHLLTVRTDNGLELGRVVAPSRFAKMLGKPELRVEDNNLHEVTLPLSGAWHGLKLANVAKSATPEGDYGFTSYRFDEPFEKVRTVLNQFGFAFDRKGEQPPRGIEDYTAASLFSVQGLTALDCQ